MREEGKKEETRKRELERDRKKWEEKCWKMEEIEKKGEKLGTGSC